MEMNNQIDITISVMIDNAVLEYEKATNKIMAELGLSVDLAEIALEKALVGLKSKKLSLYASAMRNATSVQITDSGTQEVGCKKEG